MHWKHIGSGHFQWQKPSVSRYDRRKAWKAHLAKQEEELLKNVTYSKLINDFRTWRSGKEWKHSGESYKTRKHREYHGSRAAMRFQARPRAAFVPPFVTPQRIRSRSLDLGHVPKRKLAFGDNNRGPVKKRIFEAPNRYPLVGEKKKTIASPWDVNPAPLKIFIKDLDDVDL